MELFGKREKLKEILLSLEEDYKDQSLICSLDGEWGSGKTFFINNLGKESDRKYVYIDSINSYEKFKYYFLDKVLEEINLAEKQLLEKLKKTFGDMINTTLEETKTGKIIKSVVHIISDNIDTDKELGNSNLVFAEYLIEKNYYDLLFNLMEGENYTIVFDDIERVLPEDAINIMNNILSLKYEINKRKIKNINIFVILNKNMLNKAFKNIYGSDYNMNGYYDKVFDFEFNLFEGQSKEDYIESRNIKQNMLVGQFKYYINTYKSWSKINYRQIDLIIYELEKYERFSIHRKSRASLWCFFEIVYQKVCEYDKYIELLKACEIINELRINTINEKVNDVNRLKELIGILEKLKTVVIQVEEMKGNNLLNIEIIHTPLITDELILEFTNLNTKVGVMHYTLNEYKNI